MNHLISGLLPAGRDPNAICLVHPDGSTETYGEVINYSKRYAQALVSLGVRPGDRVLVKVEKSPEALYLYLGCIRAGAVFLPLNTAYTLNETEYFVRDAEPSVIVCRTTDIEPFRQISRDTGTIDVVSLDADGTGTLATLAAGQKGDWTDVARGPDDLAAILYTSGTTGRSKGAMLSHDNIRSNAEVLVRAWRFTPDDVLVHALPIFHAHGLYVGVNVTLATGSRMIFLPKFDPAEVLSWLPRATVMMGVPTFYTRLLDQPGFTREACAAMRLFVSGSAPLLAETHRVFAERTGHAILERYGMTETCMNTSNPYDGERVPGSVGPSLEGISVRIRNPDDGGVIPSDEIGMIEVKGPNVFSGYWRMPEKTKTEFRSDGFFITGDLGKIDEHGYVWILGRGKDLVISGGYNVYPKEVELEIDALPGVMESAVIGVPHPDFGEAVTAIVVPEKGAVLEESAVIAALQGKLARFKLPKRVYFVDELPRNTMAKVQKNVLRERFGKPA